MTNYQVEYHPAAEREIYEAAQWYKERSATAALRFAIELEARIAIILNAPERWPVFEGASRGTLLNRFPFSVIYRVTGHVVEIVALMHHRRDPNYWLYRETPTDPP